MSLAYVALGGNIDNPVKRLLSAMDEFDRLPKTRLLRASSLYRTEPVGYSEQPEFVNAVALLETSLSAMTLLLNLFAIENQHGRVRSMRNGPRTLDLDLLLYDDHVVDSESLVLPHPRMHSRAFVLVPLLEVAPDCRIPGHGSASALLGGLSDKEEKVLRISSGADAYVRNLAL